MKAPDFYAQIVTELSVAYLKVTDEDEGNENMDEAMYVASSRNKRGGRCLYFEAEAKAYAERAKSKESWAPNPPNPPNLTYLPFCQRPKGIPTQGRILRPSLGFPQCPRLKGKV